MGTESATEATDNTALKAACSSSGFEVNNPHVVVEYAGEFSSAVNLCNGAGSDWEIGSTMATAIQTDITALTDISIAVDGTSMTDDFADQFAWAKHHDGAVRARFSFTLPIGADGDSFKLHFQSGRAQASGTQWFGQVSSIFKIFTYRERNNNGREFTVTKAYENKVSDLISVSRVASYVTGTATNAGSAASGGSLAGVIHSPLADSSIEWKDSHATYGCGSSVNGKMTPGTYYNVRTKAGLTAVDGTAAGTAGTGTGAVLIVVVSGDGDIKEVQVTSGGNGFYKAGDVVRFADTRLHADMAFITSGSGTTECSFQVGDMTSTKSMSSPLKSVASGIISDTTLVPGTVPTGNTYTQCITITDTDSDGCDADGAALYGARFQNVPVDANIASENSVKGIRMAVECVSAGDPSTTAVEKVTTTFGGLGGLDAGDSSRSASTSAEAIAVGTGKAKITVTSDCVNDFYYQFGFYSTTTPRWSRDVAQNNYDQGVTPKDEQVVLYGMKNHMQYQFKHGSTNQATNSFYGLGRDTFSDLNAGMDNNMAGYSIRDATNQAFPQMTASVLAGENGQKPTSEFMEHAEKYAYIGKGYDKLTVTPLPDSMTNQKVVIQYTGPSAGCKVTEVDRGTHESAECSGRGNCDHSTGTCVCDAGYTLEACSEQTVLV